MSFESPLHQHRELIGRIKLMVDAFERFHKHAQLMGAPLSIPILNESRYLSRALTDAIHLAVTEPPQNNNETAKSVFEALMRARHAASSALHDSVDQILAIVVKSLFTMEFELKNQGRSPVLITHLDLKWRTKYLAFLDAYKSTSETIATSRAKRDQRDVAYLDLLDDFCNATESPLEVVIDFFLSLRLLEAFIFSQSIQPDRIQDSTAQVDKP